MTDKIKTVGIVDYGAGNMFSVSQAVSYAGGNPILLKTPEQIIACDRILLPGVGAAAFALNQIRTCHFDEALFEAVRVRGAPLLGICLGMHMLAEQLYEHGVNSGLGWIKGHIVPLHQVINDEHRSPHMGWNAVRYSEQSPNMMSQVTTQADYFFAHSYTLAHADQKWVVGISEYGGNLISAIEFENIFAVQFHPEKSQRAGQLLFNQFLAWNP